jgi:ATP-binding cassette subfamily B (MDR/TAP) protein 1
MPSSINSKTNSDHKNTPAQRKRKNGSVKPRENRESRSNSLQSKPKDGQSVLTSSTTSPSHHKAHHHRPKSTGTQSRSSSNKRNKRKQIESMKNGNSKVESKTATIEIEKLKEAKKAQQSQGCCSGLGILYNFADGVDIQLMIVGTLLALVQAALPPFVWLVMGDFVTFAIEREEVKQNKTQELDHLSKHGQTFSSIQEFENSSTGAALAERQVEVDQKFEAAANPVFIAMFSLSIATFLAAFFQRLAWEWSGIRQVFRIKKAYIKKLLNMDVAWLESRHSGQVAGMLHDHADSIYQGMADHMPMVIFISSYLVVSLSVCFYIQWDVTLVMCAALPLLIGTRLIFSKWFAKTLDDELSLQNKISNLVTETFQCIRTVIAFSAQKQTIHKYERLSTEHNRMTEERLRASSVYDSLAQVLLTELVFTAALCYGMWRVGDENPGRLAALAINMLYMCVTSISIGFHMNGVSNARQNAAEMTAILNELPNIESEKNACVKIKARYKARKENKVLPELTCETSDGIPIKHKPKGNGAISFKNVHFSYPSRPDVEVLKGVSLDIKPGEHIAIVGSSGSGKSTLTALILRFYDPISGSVELDHCDLRKMDPDDIRAEIGLVSQEPVLFDGTISDNIRYGKLAASQADINDAARRAEAWQFISALPEGMKTRVGDRGLQLSGGQKQRVAIARAVIRNPSVIIFDEATSALDTKHEGEVQKAIDAASQGVTTITIAHRLSTVRYSDRIIVLDAGQIVEEGKPEELMATKEGKFYRMYTDQRLDALPIPTNAAPKLKGKFSMGPADISKQALDPESRRRAWARSSLGANKKLGKSYSVLSNDRQKLALPVMSKKRSRLDKSFKTNVMEVAVEEKTYEEDYSLPGKSTNYRAVWRLIKSFKHGYTYLATAIPVTILRGLFFLLVCFEVASVLEIAMAPDTQRTRQVLIVAAIYTALIIIKTMFEAVGRLTVALYGHGFSIHLRGQMFRKILRHGAAYFDEEENSPGRLVHKLITDTASLNRILGDKLDLLLPAIVCSIVSVAVAFWINWKLAAFCSFQFPVFFYV